MNYKTKLLIRDGAMSQLEYIAKLYKNGYITAEECAEKSNEVLYTVLSSFTSDDLICYDFIEEQHKSNFYKYKNWVDERIANE